MPEEQPEEQPEFGPRPRDCEIRSTVFCREREDRAWHSLTLIVRNGTFFSGALCAVDYPKSNPNRAGPWPACSLGAGPAVIVCGAFGEGLLADSTWHAHSAAFEQKPSCRGSCCCARGLQEMIRR